MSETACGLLCVCACLGTVPVIRAPPGGPAAMVARQLDRMLRDHLVRRAASAPPSLATAPDARVRAWGNRAGRGISHFRGRVCRGRGNPGRSVLVCVWGGGGGGGGSQLFCRRAHCFEQRPVLIIVDRNMDLATPLQHTASYQVRAQVASLA